MTFTPTELDPLFVITATRNGKTRVTAVTHSQGFARTLIREGKSGTFKRHSFQTVLPRYRDGRIKETFKVHVVVDRDNTPVKVMLDNPEDYTLGAFEKRLVFDSAHRRTGVNTHYDKWYILLDNENWLEEETLTYRDSYERVESNDRLKKNPNSGHLVFITHRRRYSNSLPYRLEISISREIGTRRTREEIAREIDEMTQNGQIRIHNLEYNVDYTLTPSRWTITDDLLVRDEEISVN